MGANNKQLNSYTQPTSQSAIVVDNNSPLSYKDWYSSYSGIIPGSEYSQYNAYLVNWYNTKSNSIPNFNLELKLNYLSLLRQLQLFFNESDVESWYNQVNLNDDKELLLAIPYFARKLKDIALYYLQLREQVKKSKITYNLVGTNTGLIQQLQEQLLTGFTKRSSDEIYVPSSVWTNIPELSSVKDNLTITVEELYDDHEYFDQSTSLPVSAYYNLSSDSVNTFFTNKDIPLSAADWIYKQGNLVATNEDINTSIDLAISLFEKYIGEDKYTSVVTSVSSTSEIYNIPIANTSNYFYWPVGAYKQDVSASKRYQQVALSAAGIENIATANDTISGADVIFVKTVRGLEGAWLKYKKYDTTETNIKAYIEGNKSTIFKFPYPGYGLSAEDINWTGADLTYTANYAYLDNNIKQLVNNAYWNQDISLSGVDPVSINKTTLIESGAYASNNYTNADKIRTRYVAPAYNAEVYSGPTNEVWLYKMQQSDIPIAPAGESVIVWPYQRIDKDAGYPDYLPSDIHTVCQPTSLSSILLPYSTSSNVLTSADIIYKTANYGDSTSQALEAAWLSGNSYSFDNNIVGVSQPGLNLISYSSVFTKFIWEGDDYTDANSVFKTLEHKPDCTFYTSASSYNQFNLCTCHQVYFTPFGHPGNQFTDNGKLADFIAEDTSITDTFDLTTWTDSQGTTYTTSSAFAWYSTQSNIGWGYGNWNAGNSKTSNKFYLRNGRPYIYYRATSPNQQTTLPELITRYSYNNNNTVWIKALKDNNNFWYSTDIPTDMVIRPGDVLIYNKVNSSEYRTLSTSTTTTTQATALNKGSIWSNYDYISPGLNAQNQPQTVIVSYPSNFYPPGVQNTSISAQFVQYPIIARSNILQVQWTLTEPVSLSSTSYFTNPNQFSFNFVPLSEGLYTISLTAITAVNINAPVQTPSTSGIYIFNNIPSITSINYFTTTSTVELSTYTKPAPGFVINTPVYGWNYNNGQPDSISLGAKPFWAVSDTTYIDIDKWGIPYRIVDGHNIISQPYISNLTLETGNYFEYERKYPTSFTWLQPVNHNVYANQNVWNTILINTETVSNLDDVINNTTNELIVLPTDIPSNISLTNIVDNEPVEICFKANNTFTWSITATPVITLTNYSTVSTVPAFNAYRPWNNLTNRFYPTFAIAATVENLYSEADKGGFFTPNNLGASTYVNTDFTATISTSSTALTSVFEDSKKRAGGRGLTKQDQPTPYTNITDNNIWLKEPVVSGPIAGTIKKSITKKYQKFVPYQSSYESNSRIQAGLILPTSRQTPWGGNQDIVWTDVANKPQSFTGVPSVSSWTNAQILKQSDKQLDTWVSDIFGNQYGLYKNIKNLDPYSSKQTFGDLWVRKNSQFVSPASQSLSGVINTYYNTSIFDELTGTGIKKMDVFFDTLYIETSGAILLEDLKYDYETDNIYSITDNARFLSLAMPVSPSLSREISGANLNSYTFAKAGETWFFPEEKYVIVSVCGLQNNILTPALYKLDLNTKNFIKIFPISSDDINSINTLTSLSIFQIESPILTYDPIKKEFVMSILAQANSYNSFYNSTRRLDHIIEFTIKNLPNTILDTITIYKPENTLSSPPAVTNSNLQINVPSNLTFTYQINANNLPTSYNLTTSTSWLTLNNLGVLSGTPVAIGNYYIPFGVSNSVGTTYYTVNINVTS